LVEKTFWTAFRNEKFYGLVASKLKSFSLILKNNGHMGLSRNPVVADN